MNVIINLGSGNVPIGNIQQGEANIEKFIEDIGLPNIAYKFIKITDNGRHLYEISNRKTEHQISMPALPIDEVRYIGSENQKIFDFPRLYVDGSSWVWKYAVGICFRDEDYE